MNNKTALAILAIALVLILGWLVLRNGDNGTDLDVTLDDVERQVTVLRDSQQSGVVTRDTAATEGESQVTVDAVNFMEQGFVVVRAGSDGTPTDVLGTSAALSGFHEDVVVTLNRPLVEGETVFVVLYADANGDGSFSVTSDEVIAEAATGAIIELTVQGRVNTATTTDETADGETQTHIVTYTDTGFSPARLTVQQGDRVVFRDEASAEMWVATAMHPTHTVYPGSGIQLCDTPQEAGIFDQCGAGAEFSFTFDQEGEWGYHNHMQASHTGRIIVE